LTKWIVLILVLFLLFLVARDWFHRG
jgi:hypothetical protein